MNLEKAVNTFLLSQPNLGTRKAYRSCLVPMRDYVGPARPIEKVTAADVIEYSSTLYESDYATATIRKHVISIKAFFNFLCKLGLIAQSPADMVKRPKIPRNIDRSKAMPDEKLTKFLEYAQWHPRLNALVRFLADSGCRIGGANDLKISDIDFLRRTATVIEKGSKKRPVAFGSSTAEALQHWIDERADDACEYVFSTGTEQMKTANLAQFFRRSGIAAGIGSWGPHSLRHRKGYQLSDQRVSISVAATVLGHESTDTTLHYYPADWDRARKAVQELSLPDEHKPFPDVVHFPTKKVD